MKYRRLTFIIAAVFVGALLVLFLWHEHLTLSRPINHQKFTNFFLIVAAVAGPAGLFLLAGQLLEQQRARIAAVMPDVNPIDAHFGLTDETREVNGRWLYQPSPSIFVAGRGPLFSIANIGVGAAKEIETQWIYDKSAVDRLAQGHYSYFGGLDGGERATLNVLKAGESATIRLPRHYLICCGTKLNLASGQSDSDEVVGVKPALRFKIKYLDIYSQIFTRVFDVDVQAYGDSVTFKFGPAAK